MTYIFGNLWMGTKNGKLILYYGVGPEILESEWVGAQGNFLKCVLEILYRIDQHIGIDHPYNQILRTSCAIQLFN
jgi:hypothetical protein